MASTFIGKLVLLVIGAAVGGGFVFGVTKLSSDSKESDDTSTSTSSTMKTTTTTKMATTMMTTTMMTTTMMTPSTEESPTDSNGTRVVESLQFVVVISRHGNRGGSKDYPNDLYPLSNTTYWPYGPNSLTTHGRLQAYNLGVKLRSLYNGFLPAIHDTGDIYCTSDTVERVIFSGECVMTGLYPPSGWQKWSDTVAWQPITVSTKSPDNSVGKGNCKRYSTEKATAATTFQEEYGDDAAFMIEYFYNNTGTTYDMDGLSDVFDKIITEDTEGYELPDWIKEVYPEPFSTLYGEYYHAITAGTDEIVRIYEGGLYDEIYSYLTKVVSGTTSQLMRYYSGHDSTILNMQVAYGVNRSDVVKVVKVGSGLILELHKDPDTSEYYVEVLLIDGSSHDLEPVALTLASCGDPCTFDNFVNTTYPTYGGVSLTTECNTI